MKNYILILLLQFSTFVFADSFTIETNPKQIVKNEQFEIIFKVETQNNTAPEISFDPVTLQILSRGGTMASTRTTYVNNQMTVKREFITSYTAISSRAGKVFIRNIEINTGSQVLKEKTKSFNILNTRVEPSDVILVAIPDKTSVYKNESIFVNYYLLYTGALRQYENRKFPKLKNFTKRSYQNKRGEDRFEYNGSLYKRAPVFTVQLFPQEVGKAIVDPMTIYVQYRKTRADELIGGFGFGIGRMASKTLSSEPVEIEVKPFPADMPADFTGLVGNLNYKLDINKTKFLVNEPIEIKLIGSGNVAFESFDAPSIYNIKALEEFEKNSDLKLSEDENATETTNFTYLPRSTGIIEAKNFTISYLDPNNNEYKRISLPLPEITVGGGAVTDSGKMLQDNQPKPNVPNANVNQVIGERSFIGPIFSFTDKLGKNIYWLNIALLGLIIIGIFLNFKNLDLLAWMYKTKYDKEIRVIKKNGIDYKGIHSILYDLDKTKISSLAKLEGSKLDNEAKEYFKNVISSLELGDYYENKKLKIPFNKKHFATLKSYLNETHKES